jgi:hypothetical protein
MPAEIKNQLLSTGDNNPSNNSNNSPIETPPEPELGPVPQTGPNIITAPEPDQPANPATEPAPDTGVIN